MNNYAPHVIVLPEDDANRQIANGFVLNLPSDRRIQVLEVAGGWRRTLDQLRDFESKEMDRYRTRLLVLLIDFDGNPNRLDVAKRRVPPRLLDRVFIIGCLREPEDLRKRLGSFEAIGRKLADDCRQDARDHWNDDHLRHNALSSIVSAHPFAPSSSRASD